MRAAGRFDRWLGILPDLLFMGIVVMAAGAWLAQAGSEGSIRVLPLTLLGWVVFVAVIGGTSEVRAFTPADRVTLGRVMLLILLSALLLGASPSQVDSGLVFALAMVVALLDALDGAIARRLKCERPFGARFDMEVDAAMLMIFSLWLFALDRAGIWVLLIGLWRYVFVLISQFRPALRAPLPFSQRRRVICGIQGVGLALCLAPGMPATASAPVAAGLLLLLSYSFMVDMLRR
ncbi:CDP-alcohol phosphatidyltransferase family protein [Spiribacter sp. C176]|uniref:CDP-alcohol phosphatidyltransferase family protein n=1 Tax=Spiribacter salilacus TaxID=2664894 RepID=A0A6N7QTC6_9GAMM|nr:CDP-alcohol phosphatidyltransferase family protein [Spiribacter salilacus]MRH78840.1 CDP-alcohol phosphatidyltransferase family protein [Spiribacter salilacus]